MYTFLYRIYFIKIKNRKADSLFSRLVIRLFNIFFPVLVSLNPVKSKLNAGAVNKNPELIVSLTSIPLRIKKVWMVIETILMQKTKPGRVILWLYKGEFNGRGSLPRKLLRLEKRGLEIRFCDENLMPHKKYFHTMLEYPGANVITVDDDILYPSDFISKLVKYHKEYPDEIIATVGRSIKMNGSKILPYREWEHVKYDPKPSFQIIPIGAGGVFFPARALHPDCLDGGKIKTCALMNSDMWLKIMSLRAGTQVVCTAGEYNRFFIPVLYRNDRKLMEANIGEGRNDKVLKSLMELYNVPVSSFKD